MQNKVKIGRTEVMVWAEPTARGSGAAPKIVKERGYDARHAKALRYIVQRANAGEPVLMTRWQAALDAGPTTAQRVVLRLCVDGLITLRGIDDPATPDAVRQYVLAHRRGAEEPEPDPAA